VLTLGLLDAQSQRQLKLHTGQIHYSLGAHQPGSDAPKGEFLGVSTSQTLRWGTYRVTPEIEWLGLKDGQSVGDNQRHHWRLGLTASKPL